ncbi:fluoride efflux transporter CrcB [Gammaproteobacteria bacterium LSUCC0112]|nr:fluoride efflux transporter CrcB [Gammaproteobacteria bacterium LSUCC0112]
MSVLSWTAIAMGGAAGALARHGAITLVQRWNTIATGMFNGLPLGTWLVNVSGSLLIGILYVLLVERLPVNADLRALLMVGFLGAFTTFSTFSLDTLLLIERGLMIQALLYTLSSVVFCLLATWLGMALTRTLA